MDRFLFVRQQIDRLLLLEPQVIVAFDGNCTAGKTTLANHLSNAFITSNTITILAPKQKLF